MPKKTKGVKSDESVASTAAAEGKQHALLLLIGSPVQHYTQFFVRAESTQYTGQFSHDFPLACAEHGLPAIAVKVLDG